MDWPPACSWGREGAAIRLPLISLLLLLFTVVEAERTMAKQVKNKKPALRRGATKRVVLSAEESKQLLARTRIRDRVRDLLSRSAIRYRKAAKNNTAQALPTAMAVTTPTPQYQLNLGKRTLLMLHAWKQPRRPIPLRPRPVNRFYVSVLLMIGLIGASGSYTYHLASRWYDEVSREDVARAVNWEGWVRKVSGKSQTFTPSRQRSQLLAEQAKRAEERAHPVKASKKRPAPRTATPSPKPKTSQAKLAHKKKLSPFDELKAWTRKRAPDVESVRVKD